LRVQRLGVDENLRVPPEPVGNARDVSNLSLGGCLRGIPATSLRMNQLPNARALGKFFVTVESAPDELLQTSLLAAHVESNGDDRRV
jgi:hypothetical protein